jgi:uncharacterized YigZ family protein
VGGQAGHQIKVKGSRFIAAVAPVETEEEAGKFIERISRKHFDATHNCFAYRLGLSVEAISRFSDAGEPSGTAGRPILEAISGRDLTDTVVVVTRYYGGTKLGTGGLARAYRACALAALEKAGSTKRYLTVDFRCQFPYPLTKEVEGLIRKLGGQVLEGEYGEDVEMTVRMRRSRAQEFREAVEVLGKGKALKIEDFRLEILD